MGTELKEPAATAKTPPKKSKVDDVEDPPYPTHPCKCGGTRFWLPPRDKRAYEKDRAWICNTCHPSPNPEWVV